MSVLTIPRAAPAGPRSGTIAVADAVLAAHGSRDPRAAVDTRKLVAAVAAARPDIRVRDAYLDFTAPALGVALDGRYGPSVVVPLLLTPAYHARVDVPGVVAAARDRGVPVRVAPVLGPVGDHDLGLDLLVFGLIRRLSEAEARIGGPAARMVGVGARIDGLAAKVSGRPWDAVMLGAAGSRDARALATVDRVAAAVAARLCVPCRAGYASGVGRPVAQAVAELRAGGAHRIAYASMFLAAGLLPDRAAAAARAAGVRVIAAPLGDAPEIAALVGIRIDDCVRQGDS